MNCRIAGRDHAVLTTTAVDVLRGLSGSSLEPSGPERSSSEVSLVSRRRPARHGSADRGRDVRTNAVNLVERQRNAVMNPPLPDGNRGGDGSGQRARTRV